jgi:AcrR family transcriptional regulator
LVLADQRRRLERALVEIVAEGGHSTVTVRRVSRRARVSTGSFYRHYRNVEACFASTYAALAHTALSRAHVAQQRSSGSEAGRTAAMRSLFEGIAYNPQAARLVLVDAYDAGPETHELAGHVTSALERILVATESASDANSRYLAAGVAAGATRVATSAVLGDRTSDLPERTDEFATWVRVISAGAAAPEVKNRVSGRLSRTRRVTPQGLARHVDLSGVDLGVVGDDRTSIRTAVAKLSLTRGFAKLTSAEIGAQAGVSQRRFRQEFRDLREPFHEAIDAIAAAASSHAEQAAGVAGDWQVAAKRAIAALCVEAARNPALARLSLVEILASGGEGLRRREDLISIAAARLRSAPPPRTRPSLFVAEASVASAWRLAQVEVAAGRAAQLVDLAPTIAHIALTPILTAYSQ